MSGTGRRETLQARILVVDDQEEVRAFLDHHLERERFVVEAVRDGEAAIDRVVSGDRVPDAIVLDLSMPVMDGFETLGRLDGLDEDVVTVVLSGHSGEREKLRAFDLGADDFVAKPFSPAVLAERLRRHLERRQESSSKWPGRWQGALSMDRNTEP